MNIGLFFGSFNPVHTGHLIIANYVIGASGLNQVWMVVSPQNPLKPQKSLLNEHHRQHLVERALEGETRIKCSTIEFQLPKPSYTIDTLGYLEEKYPANSFTIILGSDSYLNLGKWKNNDILAQRYAFLIYQRPGFAVQGTPKENVKILNAPLLDISSTAIRQRIKENLSIRYFVPDVVNEEITKNHYYRVSPT